jgi:hypothetical protein
VESQVEFFVEAMETETIKSKAGLPNSGFKSTQWQAIWSLFKINANLALVTLTALHSKYSELKKTFKEYHQLFICNSGFGWDETAGIFTASTDVWDSYIAKHPEAKKFRDLPLPFYDSMMIIFTGTFATGKYSKSSCCLAKARMHEDGEDEDSSNDDEVVNAKSVDFDELTDTRPETASATIDVATAPTIKRKANNGAPATRTLKPAKLSRNAFRIDVMSASFHVLVNSVVMMGPKVDLKTARMLCVCFFSFAFFVVVFNFTFVGCGNCGNEWGEYWLWKHQE